MLITYGSERVKILDYKLVWKGQRFPTAKMVIRAPIGRFSTGKRSIKLLLCSNSNTSTFTQQLKVKECSSAVFVQSCA